MQEIWTTACSHYDVPAAVADAWYERIQQQLNLETGSTRVYHNWNEMMLRKRAHLERCKPSTVLAVFFQYYAFDGKRSCVPQNCAAFAEFCRDALIEDTESKNLILKLLGDKSIDSELTTLTCYEEDANLLQDLDLVILAASPEDYKNYTQLLRREYDHMNESNYKLMRLKVLEALLMIPNIFSTPEFQTKYEEAARTNIKQEISELKA